MMKERAMLFIKLQVAFIYLVIIAIIVMALTGCSTTALWRANDHKMIMQQCSISCSGSMRMYQPEQGICICDVKDNSKFTFKGEGL